MYSAWLKQNEWRWTRTHDIEEALDHQGDFITCHTELDEQHIAQTIEQHTGLHTYCTHCNPWVVLTAEHKIFKILDQETIDYTKQHGTAYVTGFDWRLTPVKEVNPTTRIDINNKGIIIKDQYYIGYEVIYDPQLWEQYKEQINKAIKHKNHNPIINAATFETIATQLAASMNMDMKGFKVEHIITWIYAHDQYYSPRKTNTIIKWVAKEWLKNPKKYKRHYKRWINTENLKKLEKRFQQTQETKNGKEKTTNSKKPIHA